MRFLIPIHALLSLLPLAAPGADRPRPSQVDFCISGLECGSCVYSVQQALAETPGVSEVEIVQMLDSHARIIFDPKVVSVHQMAQAVREAFPLHGNPYLATLRLRIPGYSHEGKAAQIKGVFARWKKWVKMEVLDEREGELIIHFLPLEKDASRSRPRGWGLAELTEALRAPAPKGLGLEFRILAPGQP
jgi:copper chaperone CopZ